MSFGIELPTEEDWAQTLTSLEFDIDQLEQPFVDCSDPPQTRSPRLEPVHPSNSHHGLASTPAKVGTRFSTASLKILKGWLHDHASHPYPSSKDIKRLEAQTGLEKQQITTWYANMRRRTKGRHIQRPTSPSLSKLKSNNSQSWSSSRPSQAIPRVPTQSPFWDMDPMQRWRNSPPEHEASAPSDILAAVQSSANKDEDDMWETRFGYLERWTSDDASSATSARRSQSSAGSSLDSINTYLSHDSSKSVDPLAAQKRRRRKRKVVAREQVDNGYRLSMRARTFQCTFCAESFATKHNWQRHEKSIHISLEGWECSPDGPKVLNANQDAICVYCGAVNPDEAHMKAHDYEDCEQREPEERVFYRKDNLQQHLRLVHNTTYQETTMHPWKRQNLLVRSRCGFCNLDMQTWAERVDHVAEHFKMGKTMADWKGGWGFEPCVADKVENSIPPYLIHYERSSPWPFTGFQGPHGTPLDAFELISAEMEHYSSEMLASKHRMPTMTEMQYECCVRIFGAEFRTSAYNKRSEGPGPHDPESWLRDLIMGTESIAREARRRPKNYTERVSCTPLCIIGKSTLFEDCALERTLQHRAQASQSEGLQITDQLLQEEACGIVRQMTESAKQPSECTQDFLIQLILSGTSTWTPKFRRRVGLFADENPAIESTSSNDIDVSKGEMDDALGQLPSGEGSPSFMFTNQYAGQMFALEHQGKGYQMAETLNADQLGDDSCYRYLMKELKRFVRSSTSPFNPTRHVPTDEELQHQARCIMYDDGDPWNQTPADNDEWLRQFKKDLGLI